MHRIKARFRNLPIEDQVDTARMVYYNMKNMEAIGACSWTLYVRELVPKYTACNLTAAELVQRNEDRVRDEGTRACQGLHPASGQLSNQ